MGLGRSGPSHCFNCSRDGHFQASCSNPPFCYNSKKDGHRSMAYQAKKGLNLKICGHRTLGHTFYNINVPEEDEEDYPPKTFPGILTIREGVDKEALIDLDLKHLFKGMSWWTIKKLGEDEFLLNFPSEDLRNELTKFKCFEFATAIVKAKMEPTNLDEVVCALEETWVKATGFPRKQKK
jgi:hypothetical protein